MQCQQTGCLIYAVSINWRTCIHLQYQHTGGHACSVSNLLDLHMQRYQTGTCAILVSIFTRLVQEASLPKIESLGVARGEMGGGRT